MLPEEPEAEASRLVECARCRRSVDESAHDLAQCYEAVLADHKKAIDNLELYITHQFSYSRLYSRLYLYITKIYNRNMSYRFIR